MSVYCKSTRNTQICVQVSVVSLAKPLLYCDVPVVAALWSSDTSCMLRSLFHAWLQFQYRDGMPAGHGHSLWVIREPEINGQEGLRSPQCRKAAGHVPQVVPTAQQWLPDGHTQTVDSTGQFWYFRVRKSDSSWFVMPQMCWTMAAVCGTLDSWVGSTPIFRTDQSTFIRLSNGDGGTTLPTNKQRN